MSALETHSVVHVIDVVSAQSAPILTVHVALGVTL